MGGIGLHLKDLGGIHDGGIQYGVWTSQSKKWVGRVREGVRRVVGYRRRDWSLDGVVGEG